MYDAQLNLPELVFDGVCLVITLWIIFDTQRAGRLLTFNRKKTVATWELWIIKGAGLIVAIGLGRSVLTTMLHH